MASLSDSGKKAVAAVFEKYKDLLPGSTFALATEDEILLELAVGKFDFLDESSREVTKDDYQFYASTTKLVTAVCILQLVDEGVISLDSPINSYFPTLALPMKVIKDINANGDVVWGETNTPILLKYMLNQSSGFGEEFGPKVQGWKKTLKEGEKGRGFVNSCKVDNLIHTPIVDEPGTAFWYGNSAEWLGLLIPKLTGVSYEEYLQEHVCKPLGLKATTFFPFAQNQADRLQPLRWRTPEGEWEVLKDQFPGLTLPRKTEEIEYPVGGGGIFSTSTDYVLILQALLKARLASAACPALSLSKNSVASIFEPSLNPSCYPGLLAKIGFFYGIKEGGDLKPGELDWTTGACLFNLKGEDVGKKRCGYGRRGGSVSWRGAGSTEYWIDPVSKIACVFGSNMLPSNAQIIHEYKCEVEKAVYDGLI